MSSSSSRRRSLPRPGDHSTENPSRTLDQPVAVRPFEAKWRCRCRNARLVWRATTPAGDAANLPRHPPAILPQLGATMPLKKKPIGKLIAFEGAEGSGTTTQIARLAKRIAKLERDVVSVREPGGTEIGEQVRNIIVHNSRGDEMCAET